MLKFTKLPGRTGFVITLCGINRFLIILLTRIANPRQRGDYFPSFRCRLLIVKMYIVKSKLIKSDAKIARKN